MQAFLQKALMPLHKPKGLGAYQQQLSYCVTQVQPSRPTSPHTLAFSLQLDIYIELYKQPKLHRKWGLSLPRSNVIYCLACSACAACSSRYTDGCPAQPLMPGLLCSLWRRTRSWRSQC